MASFREADCEIAPRKPIIVWDLPRIPRSGKDRDLPKGYDLPAGTFSVWPRSSSGFGWEQ